MSFCDIVLVGNVGRDPELRYTGSGMAVCSFSLAVSRARRVNDTWQEDTTWFKVTVWGEQAERANQNIQKGKQVLVQGDRIEASAYTSKDGELRTSLEVTARQVRIMGRRDEGQGSSSGGSGESRGGRDDYYEDYGDTPNNVDDIPF